jgi:hypothetical protein
MLIWVYHEIQPFEAATEGEPSPAAEEVRATAILEDAAAAAAAA